MLSWPIFAAWFASLLAFDFYMTRGREVSMKRSLSMTAFYIVSSLTFSLFMYYENGLTAFSQFITIYWLEQLLSVDNLLVMSLIFAFFGIACKEQHKALLLGILGAIVFRATFILSGTLVIGAFSWMLYVFATFLMWTGFKIMTSDDDGGMNPEEKKFIVWIKKKFGNAGAFFGAIIAVEICDIMFAVDSIPASFSITQNAYVILTANLCAVLGLRSLYHAVEKALTLVEGLEKYIGLVLVSLGGEVFINHFTNMTIPAWGTMLGTFTILAVGVTLSLMKKKL